MKISDFKTIGKFWGSEKMQYTEYKQNLDDIKNYYNQKEMENKKYRGRIPKKKRIRKKILKHRNKQRSPLSLDKFHEYKWMIV